GSSDGVAVPHDTSKRWKIAIGGDFAGQYPAQAVEEFDVFQAFRSHLGRVLFYDVASLFKAQAHGWLRDGGHAADHTRAREENLMPRASFGEDGVVIAGKTRLSSVVSRRRFGRLRTGDR